MRLSTVLAWLVVLAGLAAIAAAVVTETVDRALVPRAAVAGLAVIVIGVALTRLAPTRTRRAGRGLTAPRAWAVIVSGGLLGGLVLATVGAVAGALLVLPVVDAPLTLAGLRADPTVRRGALAGAVVLYSIAAGAGLTAVARSITAGLGVESGPAVALAGMAAGGVALAPLGTRPLAGLAVAGGLVGVGLFARPAIRGLLARAGVSVLPPRSEWAHASADGERAHRRAQRRAPPLDIGETATIVVQERRDGGRQLRGVHEDFQVFVKWDVPADCATGETVCVRIEDYGTNDAGQRTSGQARFLSRGAC